MSTASLKDEVRRTLLKITEQIWIIEEYARSQGIDPPEMRTPDGSFVLAPLLLAKTTALLALTNLEKS